MTSLRKFSSFSTLALASLLAMLLLGGCGKKQKGFSTNNRIILHELSNFERLNPFNSTGANETYCEEEIYERLLRVDPKTLEYNIPWLAESLPVESADHMQFDFTLRKDVKFADGQPLTGNDVIFSLKALKNPYNMSSAQKRVYVDNIHSAELIDGDPYRVRFKMWKPYVLIKQAAFGDVLYILPKHVLDPKGLTDKYSWEDIGAIVEKGGAEELDSAALAKQKANPAMQEFANWFNTSEIDHDPKYLFGSGPYKVDKWQTNEFVRLVKNPQYVNHWGTMGEAHADTLVHRFISDWNAAVTAVKSRDIDFIGYLQAPYYVQVDTAKTKGIRKTTFVLPSYTYIGYNMKNPLFSDVRVRRAIAMLTDRKTIIEKVQFNLARTAESPVNFARPEYNKDLKPVDFDPEGAKKLLMEAGWADHDGDGILDKTINGKSTPFQFVYLTNAGNKVREQVLLIVAEALRKVGIKADVSTIEWSVYLERVRDHKFDAHFGAWQQDPYEADNYQLFHSSQAKNRGSNYDNYMNPEADKLMEQIRSEMDDAKRIELHKKLQQILHDDQVSTFLWIPENPTVWVDRFDNMNFFPVRPGYNPAAWIIRGAQTAGGGQKQAAF